MINESASLPYDKASDTNMSSKSTYFNFSILQSILLKRVYTLGRVYIICFCRIAFVANDVSSLHERSYSGATQRGADSLVDRVVQCACLGCLRNICEFSCGSVATRDDTALRKASSKPIVRTPQLACTRASDAEINRRAMTRPRHPQT